MGLLRNMLAHPLTRGMDLDDPKTTALRIRIIQENPFLSRIYDQWYRFIADSLPAVDGRVLELGSGAGYLRQYVPDVLTSEIFTCPGIDVVLDAHRLPLADDSLRAIVMTDVLHHLCEADKFLAEAQRCLKAGGRIVMIEPWVSAWSRLIYRNLHHEPFEPDSKQWGFPRTGPLSGANGALPWIVFERDRATFAQRFPAMKILQARPILPLRYLVSGGVSMRPLMPRWTARFWESMERGLEPWMKQWGMFAQIIVERSK